MYICIYIYITYCSGVSNICIQYFQSIIIVRAHLRPRKYCIHPSQSSFHQLLIDLIGQVLGFSCPALYPTFVYIPSDKIPGSLIETHFTSVARPSTLQLFKRLNPYLPDPAYIHFVHALLELVLLCFLFSQPKKKKKKKKKLNAWSDIVYYIWIYKTLFHRIYSNWSGASLDVLTSHVSNVNPPAMGTSHMCVMLTHYGYLYLECSRTKSENLPAPGRYFLYAGSGGTQSPDTIQSHLSYPTS